MSSANHDPEQEFIDLETRWARAIQAQDATQMSQFLADSYFLAIGTQGLPLRFMPRAKWLETLPAYKTETFAIDDIHVGIHGSTAIVFMLFTQKATVHGQDRSGQFVLTDIWVRQDEGWRVAERHSSRPEPQVATRP